MVDVGQSCTAPHLLLDTVGLSRFSCMEFPYMLRVSDSGEPAWPRLASYVVLCATYRSGLPFQVTRSALPTRVISELNVLACTYPPYSMPVYPGASTCPRFSWLPARQMRRHAASLYPASRSSLPYSSFRSTSQ